MNRFVHQHKTTEWAQEVGFPPAVAQAIGEADAEVDVLGLPRNCYHMRPVLLLGHDRRLVTAEEHLRHAREAAEQRACTGAWRHLGYGLHALQDREAHGPWWLLGIHWFSWLDDPERTHWGWPDREHARLARLEEVTKAYLQRAWEEEPVRRCAGASTAAGPP